MNFFERVSQRFGMPIAQPQFPQQPMGIPQNATVYHDPNQNIEGPWTTDAPMNYGRETLGNFEGAQPQEMENPFGIPAEGPQDGDYYAPEIAPQPQYAPAPQAPQSEQYTPPVSGRGYVEEDVQAPALGGVRGSGDPTMQTATPEGIARAQQVQQQLGTMINDRNVSDDQIRAWVSEQGLVPDGLEEALSYRRVNPHYQVPVFAQPVGQARPAPPVPPEVSKERAFMRGGIDTVTLGGDDELYGAGKAVDYLFGQAEGDSFYDAYVRGKNARTAEKDAALYHRPGYYIGGQIVGGLATAPMGGAAANAARGVGLLRGGSLVRGLQTGAVTGGVYGFNSDEGGVTDRLDGLATGAAFGTAAAGVVGSVANGARRLYRSPRAGEVMDTAARVNANLGTDIRPSVAHLGSQSAEGGASIRGRMSLGLRNTLPGVTPLPIVGSLDGNLRQFGDDVTQGLETLAQRTGAQSDSMTYAGLRQLENRPGTIAGYRDVSEGVRDGLYRNADQLGGGTMIQPTHTVATLDRMMARLALSPPSVTGEAIAALQGIRDDLASQSWAAAGLRDIRTRYGRQLDAVNGMTRGDANQMWGALSRDITDGMHRAGRGEAARAYRQADRYNARREQTLDIVEDIIGTQRNGFNSAELVGKKLEQMARTGSDDLDRVMRQLPRAEAADIRGNIVRRLGVAKDNTSGVEGAFSIQTFGTEWKKLGERARSVLFDANTQRDLDDLAELALAAKSVPVNNSNSAVGLLAIGATNVAQWGAGYNAVVNGDLNSGTGAASLLGGAFAIGSAALLGDRRLMRGLINWGRTGNTAQYERTITDALRRTARNPTWQMELIGLRDYIAGHNSNPQVVVPQNAGDGGSIFDEQPASDGPPKPSIFDDEPIDPNDPDAMINPFGTEPDEDEAPFAGSEYEGMTPQEMVDDGMGGVRLTN